jgi:hypothetical protein
LRAIDRNFCENRSKPGILNFLWREFRKTTDGDSGDIDCAERLQCTEKVSRTMNFLGFFKSNPRQSLEIPANGQDFAACDSPEMSH